MKFADDTSLIGLNNINDETMYLQQIDRFVNYCDGNHLVLNVSKAKGMIVDFRKQRRKTPEQVVIKDAVVERVNEYKYLGVVTDDNSDFHKHVEYV